MFPLPVTVQLLNVLYWFEVAETVDTGVARTRTCSRAIVGYHAVVEGVMRE